MESQLKDRVAIVTGGSKGIGQAIALALARKGAAISLCARNHKQAETVAREIRDFGGRALAVACDVSQKDDVNHLVTQTIEAYGHPDILVANAGVLAPTSPVHEIPLDDWKQHQDINVTGVFLCIQAVLPHMMKRDYGRIQILGSGLEHTPIPTLTAYSASKSAINALTRVAAKELEGHDIKINIHYPGDLRTDMNPGGTGKPEDAVPCALYLASLPADGPSGRTFTFDKEILFLTEEVPRKDIIQ